MTRNAEEATTTMSEQREQRRPIRATLRDEQQTRFASGGGTTNGIKGTIKAIKKQEGFGFVTHSATGEDYFFHRSQVAKNSKVPFEQMELDQEVAFTPVESPKGLRATEIRVI